MKQKSILHTILLGSSLLAASPMLQAATVIADFTYDINTAGVPNARPAAYDGSPNVFTDLNTTTLEFSDVAGRWNQASTNVGNSYLFSYDISGLAISNFALVTATSMDITVSTVGGQFPFSAAGNGVAVTGGDNNNWLDDNDPAVTFSVVIRDSLNADITNTLTVDLTGVGMRWATAASATIAGQSISRVGGTSANPPTDSVWLEGVDLPTGETAETSFTAFATADNQVLQIQQLRFTVIPEPSTALLGGLGLLALLRRRRN